MPMTRHQATAVALQSAKAHPEAYMSAPDFKPHRWVTTAIMLAAADTPRPQLVDLMALKMAVISAGLGICALSERDLLDRLEELCIHGVGIGARSIRAVIDREIATELACHEGADRLPIETALRSLAARLQAPNDEPAAAPAEDHLADLLRGWIQTVKDAHDESHSDHATSSRSMLRGLAFEMEEKYRLMGTNRHRELAQFLMDRQSNLAADRMGCDEEEAQAWDTYEEAAAALLAALPRAVQPDSSVITEAQISAGAAITTMDGKPIGRNTAIDAFHAMCKAGAA